MIVRSAHADDLASILCVQHEAFGRVARDLGLHSDDLPPLQEEAADLLTLFEQGVEFFVAVDHGRIVGSVRAKHSDASVEFGRLVVSASHLRRGIATRLMNHAEAAFPQARRFELFTGEDALAPLALYSALGYRVTHREELRGVRLVWLAKDGCACGR